MCETYPRFPICHSCLPGRSIAPIPPSDAVAAFPSHQPCQGVGDAGKVTPYSLGATEAFDMVFNGGKQDDITVVVAMLCAPSPPLQSSHNNCDDCMPDNVSLQYLGAFASFVVSPSA